MYSDSTATASFNECRLCDRDVTLFVMKCSYGPELKTLSLALSAPLGADWLGSSLHLEDAKVLRYGAVARTTGCGTEAQEQKKLAA